MNHLKIINDYLKARGERGRLPDTGYPFVTISRQAGAGGHLTAYVLTSSFMKERDLDLFGGWHVFDREICQVVAMDPTLHSSIADLLCEGSKSAMQEFLEDLLSGESRQYKQHKKTFEIVRMLAIVGKVVLVGRAAAFVTRGLPHGIHMRIVAPIDKRVRWMAKKLNISREEARKTIDRQDAERKRMVKNFFSRDIDDPLNYDMVWNTAMVNPDEIAAAVTDIIKSRRK